jgi:hypothetical protein
MPIEPYVFAEWRVRRVGIDYHVDVEGHFYSVPYRFARAEVEVRLTRRTIEIFARGERIAVLTCRTRSTPLPLRHARLESNLMRSVCIRLRRSCPRDSSCMAECTPSCCTGGPHADTARCCWRDDPCSSGTFRMQSAE